MFLSRRIINSFFILVFMLVAGCGKKGPAAGSPEEVLFLLRDRCGDEDVLELYSAGTIKELEKYMDASGMEMKSAINTLSFIPEKAAYEVHDVKINGDKCTVNLRYMKDGPEKSRGLVVNLTMVKENGSWRIDRSDDFRKLVKSQVNRGAEDYLNRIR